VRLGNPLSTDLLTFSPLVVAVVAFASTNVDDLFLLGSLFVDSEFRTGSVVLGQFFGMAFLVIVSILAALFTLPIPGGWVSALGLAPLLLGFQRLWRLVQKPAGSHSNLRKSSRLCRKRKASLSLGEI
jgi:cadmium resistance protein CadD (predicted permease)